MKRTAFNVILQGERKYYVHLSEVVYGLRQFHLRVNCKFKVYSVCPDKRSYTQHVGNTPC
jgi:hypothetical protein